MVLLDSDGNVFKGKMNTAGYYGHKPSGAPQPLPPPHKIITAIECGDFDTVRLLLVQDGTLANEQNAYGESCLMIAATKGHLDICETLLREGVDSDIETQLRSTALSAAKKHGKVDVVALLEAHADSDL